ncbi:unnamed protein product [Prorocentrum cordatum]|uniref:Uncharacterized protein n=1 Tax=Prorocentrum cordatum TaxID=2364126 RepID=A0ABN9SPW5_9DINO|nr:unnamed protein product [Polarella glacialis]
MPAHDAEALAAQGAALELCEERAADREGRGQAEQLAAQSRRLEQLRRVEAVGASLGAVEEALRASVAGWALVRAQLRQRRAAAARASPGRGAPAAAGAGGAEEVPKKEEQATFDLARYTDPASLFDALAFTVDDLHPVRLVRMTWLLQQRGAVLKRRQELPEEAFVSADELRAVWEAGGRGGKDQVAPIIAISFCWDSREHPDPKGLQLNLVIDTLQMERLKYSTAKGDFKGFGEMGIFWDWPSLLQGDPVKADEAKAAALRQGKSEKDAQETADKAKRTPAEKAAFKHGLEETMDLWYAHQATTVFLLTQHPRERDSAREYSYDQSGWTTYERCSAEQIKQVWRRQAKWHAVADLGQGAGGQAAGRRWPVGPDEFDRLIKDRHFTNGADREAVKALFRRMSLAQLGGVTTLDFEGMLPPTPEEAAGLAGCLRLCHRLETLDLQMCEIGAAGAKALAGALPSMTGLTELDLTSNKIGTGGAKALAGALPSLAGLTVLWLNGNSIGAEGAQAVQAAWGDRDRKKLLF